MKLEFTEEQIRTAVYVGMAVVLVLLALKIITDMARPEVVIVKRSQ